MKLITKRLILESIVGVCFIITTVIAVLIAQGNIITSEGEIIETGVIQVNSIPDGVLAYLDEKPVPISNNRIQNVIAGKTTLRLFKEGYTPWEKLIEVNNEKITYVYAQLYPLELQRKQIITQDIDNLEYSLDRSRLVYTVVNSSIPEENGVWKLEFTPSLPFVSGNQSSKVYTFSEEILNTLKTFPYELSISPDNTYLLLQIPTIKALYKINIQSPDEVQNLVSQIGFYPEYVQWLQNSNTILIQQGNLLYELKLDTGERTVIFFDPEITPIYSANRFGVLFKDTIRNQLTFYTNQSTLPVSIPATSNENNGNTIGDIDISKVTQVYTPSQSQNSFIVLIDNTGYYVNTEKLFTQVFPDVNQIYSISPDGLSCIFLSNSTFKSFVFDPVLLKTSISTINEGEVGTIYYTASNKQFMEVNVGEGRIEVVDIDGKNRIALLENAQIKDGTEIFMTSQGKSLYIVLSSSDVDGKSNYNLYQIDLSIE